MSDFIKCLWVSVKWIMWELTEFLIFLNNLLSISWNISNSWIFSCFRLYYTEFNQLIDFSKNYWVGARLSVNLDDLTMTTQLLITLTQISLICKFNNLKNPKLAKIKLRRGISCTKNTPTRHFSLNYRINSNLQTEKLVVYI